MENQIPMGDWRELWTQYGHKLLLFARQQAPCLDDAEDVVQEAFVRYWKAFQVNPNLSPTLLFLNVKRVAIDHARKWKSRLSTEIQHTAESFFVPTETGQDDRNQAIEDALKSLPPEQREILVLKIWGELTFEEISQTLNISPHTAASRYRYALNKLKEVLIPSLQ